MEAAEKARKYSYSPYSKFRVGAALLTKTGKIITGSNIENASYGLSVCAERAAFFKAVSSGERGFKAVAVSAGPRAAPPCGACLQVMSEFSDDMTVLYTDDSGRNTASNLKKLMPKSFAFRK